MARAFSRYTVDMLLVSLPLGHGQRVRRLASVERRPAEAPSLNALLPAGHTFDDLTLELTRIVIALSVFAVGVELPKYVASRCKCPSKGSPSSPSPSQSLCHSSLEVPHYAPGTHVCLSPASPAAAKPLTSAYRSHSMFLGWMISAALMYAIIPGLEFLPALVVAAGVTPTDPILASSVVGKGKFAQEHVPAHIRHILQAESGCNDGAAFPFLVSQRAATVCVDEQR